MRNQLSLIGIAGTFSVLAGCASVPTRTEQPQVVVPQATPAPRNDSSSNPSGKEEIPFTGKNTVHRFKLSNGLNILIFEDHSSPTLAYQTWFKVGSRNEVPNYTGLAHFFEHMMFKRTKNHPEGEFDRLLERAGAEGANAFTSNDYTAYVQELPKQHLELIASLESDRMTNLIVDQEAFRTEREVVQNERRMRTENNPDGIMYQELMKTSFTQHPYRWPVLGYEEDLSRMTEKDAEQFYLKYYNPSRATVVIVGDVNPQETLNLLSKYYGVIPEKPISDAPIPRDPEQTAPRRLSLKLNLQVEKVLIGFPIPDNLSETTPALDLLEAVLSSGRAARLDRALVDTGIATGAGCDSNPAVDPSLFICSASLQDKKSAVVAERIILSEIQRLATTPVSEAELERAKNLLTFGIYQGLTTNASKANMLGHLETQFGSFENGLKMIEKLAKVTPQDILSVAKTYLKPEKRNVVIGVPK